MSKHKSRENPEIKSEKGGISGVTDKSDSFGKKEVQRVIKLGCTKRRIRLSVFFPLWPGAEEKSYQEKL